MYNSNKITLKNIKWRVQSCLKIIRGPRQNLHLGPLEKKKKSQLIIIFPFSLDIPLRIEQLFG